MHADNRQQLLAQTVADFFDVDAPNVNRAFALSGPRMQGSLPRYALDAAIRRRVGVTIAAVHKAATYGELEDELLGRGGENISAAPTGSSDDSTVRTAAANPSPVSESNVRKSSSAGMVPQLGSAVDCGVDIQRVDSLPRAGDVWEHPFYCETFTKAEIAYCLSRENPEEHFAARWCAKEAVKKCDAAWLEADMKRIEVVLETQGAPSLWSTDGARRERLPFSLSLSHTAEMAIAMVVGVAAEPQQSAPQQQPELTVDLAGLPSVGARENGTEQESTQSNSGDQSKKKSGRGAVLVALLGLAVASFALWRTFQ